MVTRFLFHCASIMGRKKHSSPRNTIKHSLLQLLIAYYRSHTIDYVNIRFYHFSFSLHFEDWINRFSKLSRDTIRWNIYIDNIHRFARSFFQRGGPSWTTKTGSKKRIETQTNQRARWNERRTYAKMLDVPLTPNPRHVVYFIALLALLHQFPSVYTSSPAVVTALSLSPSPSLPLALSREHHSTRIKYWLRFWFIVIAGGIARGSEAKPVRFERDGAIEARGGRKRRKRRRRRVDSAEGGWSPLPVSGGVWRRGDDGHGGGGWEESHSIAFNPQMHLPKRCGRFCLVLRRHAACRYYSAFLFFSRCYPSPRKILMLLVWNNRGIYFVDVFVK